MLRKNLEQLFQELDLGSLAPPDREKTYQIRTGDRVISLRDLDPGVYLFAQIAPLPPKKQEELFISLMKANFLGQGTGGAVIGLTEDESFLTLSSAMPYEMNFRAFKEALEEFINFLDYWKKEVAKHQLEAATN